MAVLENCGKKKAANSLSAKYIWLTLLILLVGAIFRFYGSWLPWTDDEPDWIVVSKEICLQPGAVWIPPYGATHGPVSAYLIKLSTMIFGNSYLGARFLGICLSILNLLIMYKIVKTIARTKPALFAMFLMALNITHIFFSKYATQDAYALLIGNIAVLVFMRMLTEQKSTLVLWEGVVLGIGILTNETILFFVLAFAVVLFAERRNLFWLREKHILTAVLFMILIPIPYLAWLCRNEFIFGKMNAYIAGFSPFPSAIFAIFLPFLNQHSRNYYDGFRLIDLDLGYNTVGYLMGITMVVLVLSAVKFIRERGLRIMLLIILSFVVICFFAKGAHPRHFILVTIPVIALSGIVLDKYWQCGSIFRAGIFAVLLILSIDTVYAVQKIRVQNKFYSLFDMEPFGQRVNLNDLSSSIIALSEEYAPTLVILPDRRWEATAYYIMANSEMKTFSWLKEQKYFHYGHGDFNRILCVQLIDENSEKLLDWFTQNNYEIKRIGQRNIALGINTHIPVILYLCEKNKKMKIKQEQIKGLFALING